MSLNHKLDNLIKEFCKNLSITYDLPEEDLYGIWKGEKVKSNGSPAAPTSAPVPKNEVKENPDTEITKEKIMVATKDMLAAMCKKKGLKMSGKKEELVSRLLDSLSSSSATSTKASSNSNSKKDESPVVKAAKASIGELAIRRNKHGNFEHMQTGLVFNTEKQVYGKQLDSGEVKALTSEDIETCKKYKFPFKLPDNLNVNKSLDDIKVDEIEEEEELDDEDIEEDVEEEDEDILDEDV
jgi:hypothetical protein